MKLRSALGFIAMSAYAGAASANGFYIPQLSIVGLGRAHAGNVVAATDPSTAYLNPAAMPSLYGDSPCDSPNECPRDANRMSAGFASLHPYLDMDDRGTSTASPASLGTPVPTGGSNGGNALGGPAPVPSVYFTHAADNNLVLGLAVNAPFGMSSKYDRDWFGRYDSISSRLLTINLQPSIAYQWGSFSIGAGVDLQYADARLTQALPQTLTLPGAETPPSPESDATGELSASDWGVGYNIGIHWAVNDAVVLGAHYRSAMRHSFHGQNSIRGYSGPLSLLNGKTGAKFELELPAIISAGVRWTPEIALGGRQSTREIALLADITAFQWSSLDELSVKLDVPPPAPNRNVKELDFRDTYMLSVGAEWTMSQSFTLRGGVSYDRTPTRDSARETRVPDGDRWWYCLGMSMSTADDRHTVDIALAHAVFEESGIARDDTLVLGTGNQQLRAGAETTVSTIAVNYRMSF